MISIKAKPKAVTISHTEAFLAASLSPCMICITTATSEIIATNANKIDNKEAKLLRMSANGSVRPADRRVCK